MFEPKAPEPEPAPDSMVWRPTHVLRGQLILGAVAALAAGGVYIAADVWEWENGPLDGLQLSGTLNLVALLPELVIVWVYWGMAKVIPPILHRSGERQNPSAGFQGGSACVFGSISVLCLWPLCHPADPLLSEGSKWAIVFGEAVALVLLLLVALAFIRRTRTGGGAIGAMGTVFFIVGMLLANLPMLPFAPGGPQGQTPLGPAAGLVLMAALICFCAFRVWFAVVKVRERHLLGNLAVAVSGVELLTVGWIIAPLVVSIAYQELMLAAMVLDGGQGLLRFSWFYALRERADQPPPRRPEYFWHTPLHEVDWDAQEGRDNGS